MNTRRKIRMIGLLAALMLLVVILPVASGEAGLSTVGPSPTAGHLMSRQADNTKGDASPALGRLKPATLAHPGASSPGRPALQAADCGYTPEDGGVPKNGIGVLDRCVTDTLEVGGVTKRIVVFFTDSGGPTYDPTAVEDNAGADSCSDGVDNGGDGDTDSDDADCRIDHTVDQADAEAVLQAAKEAWQAFSDQGFRSPRHDGGEGTDDGSSNDKDNRLDVWIEALDWTVDDSGGGRTRKSAWGVAWWNGDHFSVDAALAQLDEGWALARKATTYHELWHRVQQSYDYDEIKSNYPANSWLLEGSAGHMQDEVTAAVDDDPNGRFIDRSNTYLGQPDKDLRDWEYKAGLWWKYFTEQTGELTDDPGLGVDAAATLWDKTLDFDGLTTLEEAVQAESDLTLDQLFQRFTVANYTKDLTSPDPRYRYVDDDDPNLAWDPVALWGVNEVDRVVSAPNDPADSISQDPWAARYFEARVNSAPDCRAFHFKVTSLGDNPTPVGLDVVTIGAGAVQDHASRLGTTSATTFLNRGYTRAVGVVTTFGDSATYRVDYGCVMPFIASVERPRPEDDGPPALVGPSNAPRPFTIRLSIADLNGNTTISGLRPQDFTVEVGDSGTGVFSAATVLGAAYVLDRYWLSVMPPLQGADGLYDLRVELVASGIPMLVPSSVRYSDQPQNDVVHVLDISGSMEGDKLEAARQAFKLLVNELAVGDYGGLVSFSGDGSELKWNDSAGWVVNSDATIEFTLQEIPDVNTRNLLRDSADPLVADDWTSIGDGLRTAADEYVNKGVNEHLCTVILLSDGAENEGMLYQDDPLNPGRVAQDLQDAGCRVDTIAFGEGTDEALMQLIAEDHGGDYYYAPDSAAAATQMALANWAEEQRGRGAGEQGSGGAREQGGGGAFTSAPRHPGPPAPLHPRTPAPQPLSTTAIPWQNELARAFDHAVTRAAGRQRIQSFSGSPNQPVTTEYNISDADDLLVLALKWLNPVTPGTDDFRMRIFDPQGTELRPTDPRTCSRYDYPNAERYCAETNEVVRIHKPMKGTWQVQIIANKPSDHVLMGNVRSDLRLELAVGAPTAVFATGTTIPQGHRVPIVALLTSPKGPIKAADVQALVQSPNGTLTTLTLYDDGNHQDGEAGDGFYGNIFYEAIQADVPAGKDRGAWDEGKEPDVRGSYNVTATALFDDLRREAQAAFVISEDLDSDSDGMSDTWENYFDPAWATTPNATNDPDLDGLTNLQEYQRGTHPLMSDTDRGGEGDGSEVAHNQNPLDPTDDAATAVLGFDLLPDNGVVHVSFNLREHNAYRVWRRTVSGGAALSAAFGPTLLGNTVATPDSTGNVGAHTSLVLDSAGNPVVSYLNTTNGDLKVLHCGNPTCTAGNSITAPDKAGSVGRYTSLALDARGNPVVSYYDSTNKDLKVLHCGNANCTAGNTIVSPDIKGDVGTYTALALDSRGRPVVAYRDEINGDIKVLRCGDANCTSGNSVFRIATPNNEGIDLAMVLDASDRPVITYYEIVNADLRLRHCSTPTCTDQTSGTFRALDVTGFTGRTPSLVLDSSGNPLVSFHDGTQHLRVVRCNDPNCGSYNSTVPDPDTAYVGGTALALDVNGFPVVAYQDAVNGDLKLLHCGDAGCTAGNTITTPDATNYTGLYPSLALDANGLPVISYQHHISIEQLTDGDLKVLHCGNINCDANETAWQVVAEGVATPDTRITVDDAVENDVRYAYRVQGLTILGGATGAINLAALTAQEMHAGGLSGRLTTTPKSDPAPPQGLVLINGDARNTMSRIVSLDLPAWDPDTYEEEGLQPRHHGTHATVSGTRQPVEMRIRNDAQFPADDNAGWVPYQGAVGTWDLGTPAPGAPARVYVQFRDAAGNISLPEADTIIYCQPDRDGSGTIGIGDVQTFASRWRVQAGSPDYDPFLDMDGDGDIDTVDLMMVTRHFGETCS